MKITDLMVGDWVLVKELAPSDLTNVISEYQHQLKLKDFAEIYNAGEYKKYDPIPLTPDILKKNGFVCADLPFEDFYAGYGLSIYGDDYADGHSNWYIICGINVSMNVTHVHELQHALKLCGIEKEIVL